MLSFEVSPLKKFALDSHTPTERHNKPPCIWPWLRQQEDILPKEELLQHETQPVVIEPVSNIQISRGFAVWETSGVEGSRKIV